MSGGWFGRIRRRRASAEVPGIACVDVVERITDYLDDAVDVAERAVIDNHLGACPGCRAALEQFRVTIRLEGRLSEADVVALEEMTRDDLIAAFRAHHGR